MNTIRRPARAEDGREVLMPRGREDGWQFKVKPGIDKVKFGTNWLADPEAGVHEAAHAWAELFVPGLGWVGFDAANRWCPDERYIRLSSGLDARAAAPIRGTSRAGGLESLEVSVAIQQIETSGSQQ